MNSSKSSPIPITIITGFLGSGKTTLLLNLIPQLPPPSEYTLCLLKNEFGDVAIDSQLSQASSITGVTELLNGCICCNLIGSIEESLISLRDAYHPDRIVIETSGSAFPATLAMEVSRVAALPVPEDKRGFVLDGTVLVVDVENWTGYEDTSYTAKAQARYTDLVVMNKWEDVGERKLDDAVDRVRDLNDETPWIRSHRGRVNVGLIFGIDTRKELHAINDVDHNHDHDHDHKHDHTSEVDVLSISYTSTPSVDLPSLKKLLSAAPKDEVYRIKGIIHAKDTNDTQITRYILNWAFGRYTLTCVPTADMQEESALRMTMVLVRNEGRVWKKKLENGSYIVGDNQQKGIVEVKQIT